MRRWRLRTLAAIAALLLTAAALLANSRTGPAGALLLAALAGIVLGNLLAERIDRLRGALLERVRPNGERLRVSALRRSRHWEVSWSGSSATSKSALSRSPAI